MKTSFLIMIISAIFALAILPAFAEETQDVMLTQFDVYLSSDDFTTQGPNHNILVLNKGNSTAVNVFVKNNDDIPHKITLASPTDSDSSTFSMFEFEPAEILVLPHETNSTKLHITVSNQTDTHTTFVTFLGQSDVFGMKGLGFFLVVDDDFVKWTDYSLRAGLPGAAFPYIDTNISEDDAEKIITNGLGTPEYLPQGYKFSGMTDWGDSQQFVYSLLPVTNQTEMIQFWKDGGMMVFYGVDGPNVNNTKSLPFRVAQDEGQQVIINDLMGAATEQTVRTVMESDIKYKVPARVDFFDDNEKFSVSIKGTVPLNKLLKVAASIPKLNSVENTAFDKTPSSLRQPDPLDLWNEHDLIIDGTIIGSTPHKTHPVTLQYDIKVNQYFKPSSKPFQLITAITNDTSTYFEPNTRALFYLKQIQGTYKVSTYSVKITQNCDARDLIEISPVLPNEKPPISTPVMTESYFDPCVADYFSYDPDFFKGIVNGISPLKQVKHGIPIEEIQCREPLFLVTKRDGSPACVKHETKGGLIGRGWMKTQVDVHDDSAFIDSTKNLDTVQIFLSLHPDATARVDHENFMVIYEQSGMREHPTGSIIQHTKRLIVNLDYEGKPAALYMECGGPITSSSPLTDFLDDPDWCFPADQTSFYPSGNPGDTITDNSDTIDLAKIVDANNQFALDFYSEISDTKGNLFFSPTSIDAVFAIVYEGAQGETTKNMEEAFGFTKDDIQRREQYKKSIDILNKKDSKYSLNTANALWVSDRYDLNPEYVDVAKTYYDGTVQNVDFVSNQGVDAINQWVSQKTNGKIENLFEQDSTDELTLLAITNTIYFKGEWEYPFVPGFTWDADFFVDKDKTVNVKMMNRRINPINHMQNDLVQMIELPYKGDRLSMLVLLPSEKNEISKLEGQLLVNNLNQWKSQMSETMAEVYLPKFAADTNYDLKSILQDMGMDIPFDKEKADLSGIAPYPGIYIDTAVHKAAVEVNELGTEAAAATGAMAKLQSGPPTTFRADHPFVYMIEDKVTGQILFMGRVMDPTS